MATNFLDTLKAAQVAADASDGNVSAAVGYHPPSFANPRLAKVMQSAPYQQIHPASIAFDASNARGAIDDYSLRELGYSIRASGFILPLVVRRRTDGSVYALNGNRRLRTRQLLLDPPDAWLDDALTEAELNRLDQPVWCMVVECDDTDATDLQVELNSQDVPFSESVRLSVVRRMVAPPPIGAGLTIAECVRRTGLAKSTVWAMKNHADALAAGSALRDAVHTPKGQVVKPYQPKSYWLAPVVQKLQKHPAPITSMQEYHIECQLALRLQKRASEFEVSAAYVPLEVARE